MHYGLMLLGYTLGGVIRGLLVAILVLAVSALFVHLEWKHLFSTMGVVLLISSLFSLAGFTNGMLAKTFDDVVLVPTFVLTPLTYLGGVFYSIDMLSPFWHKVALLNPIFYMVDLLRYNMINHQNTHLMSSLSILCALIIALVALNLTLLKKGTGIRD